jgi:hypothetical protein
VFVELLNQEFGIISFVEILHLLTNMGTFFVNNTKINLSAVDILFNTLNFSVMKQKRAKLGSSSIQQLNF